MTTCGLVVSESVAVVFLINPVVVDPRCSPSAGAISILQKGIAIIRKSKTSTVCYVRMSEEVKTVSKACMRKVGEERIFRFTTPDGLLWAFRKAVSRAGIKDFRPRDARHCHPRPQQTGHDPRRPGQWPCVRCPAASCDTNSLHSEFAAAAPCGNPVFPQVAKQYFIFKR